MEKIKISVCTTVYNEEKSIKKLLQSLIEQDLKPDEIIIVDGGSKDKTIEIIKKFQKKYPFIKLFVKKLNIPKARNLAIEKAKNELIAFVDAGCFAKKDWLKTLYFILKKENADISSTLYKMKTKNPLQKAFSLFVGIHKKYFNSKTFLPSTRSVLLKRKVWKKLKGFNEKLSAGEDQEFFLRAKEKGFKFACSPQEKVVWFDFQNLTLWDMAKKFYLYAKGDAQSKIFWSKKGFRTHNLKILLIFARYLIFLILFFLNKYIFLAAFLIYLFYAFFKFSKLSLDLKTRLCFVIIQLISDFSVMAGFLAGTIGIKSKVRPQPTPTEKKIKTRLNFLILITFPLSYFYLLYLFL